MAINKNEKSRRKVLSLCHRVQCVRSSSEGDVQSNNEINAIIGLFMSIWYWYNVQPARPKLFIVFVEKNKTSTRMTRSINNQTDFCSPKRNETTTTTATNDGCGTVHAANKKKEERTYIKSINETRFILLLSADHS